MDERTDVAIPTQDVALAALPAEVMEKVVIGGDLSVLNASQRGEYYTAVCKGLGLNPLTKPFEYLNLNGKLRLYALRDCADQLRRLHGISIYIVNRATVSDIYVVTARAKDRTGREDESTGAVPIGGLKGEGLANAYMKSETKAKRRVTLSIAGLGWLDESELDTIPAVSSASGEGSPRLIKEHPDKEDMDTLQEYAKAAGVDEGEFWGQIKRMLDIPATEKITKKGIRDRMTMSQYEAADVEYRSRIKEEVEASVVTGEVVEPAASAQTASMDDGGEDVADFHAPETPKDTTQDTTTTPERRPSPTAEQATTEPTGATNGHHALTAQYITELRALALPVSPKIYEEVQGIIQRNPGMPERVYTTTKAWLLAPKNPEVAS